MSEIDRKLEMYDAVWASYNQLFDSMVDNDWTVQSLCPDWDVRGAIVHVFGVEHALDGWFPESVETPVPFDKVAAYAELTSSMSADELVADCRRLMALRREQIAALSDDDLAKPSMTPVGPGTYGRFLDIRVFDFWVHERDVRIPLARPAGSDGGPDAVRSLDEVAMSIGYIAGKKVGLPDGQSISFRLTAPVERTVNVAVDGRAAAVETLQNPTAVVTTDSTTFVMLACGRIDPEEQIANGKISWSGDEALGEKAARNLRFTM
ncbi:MAG: hypothetical protein ACI8TP_003171 [Acidimicrobiales bacterium]|jgi:uncharacterized protein (TIGR03083 family)